MYPRRHQIIACSLWRGAGEHRRLDIDESKTVQVITNRHGNPVSQAQVLLHYVSAQVQDPVLKPRVFGEIVIVELKRRSYGRVQNLDFVRENLDLARADVRVRGALRPPAHPPRYTEHELTPNLLRSAERIRAVRIADHLGQAFTITKIDEDHAAMVPAPMRPAAERYGLIDKRGRKLAAVVCAHRISRKNQSGMDGFAGLV